MLKLYKFIIFLSFFSILIGNFSRFISFNNNVGSLNFFELFIPLFTIFIIPVMYSRDKIPFFILISIFIFIISMIVGISKFGINLNSIGYNIQFCLFLIFSHFLGISIYKVYGFNVREILKKYINFNFYLCCLSIIIFIIFPEAINLYKFLSNFNIIYNGDNHSGRVLSSFLEPNFFGLYIVLPIYLLIVSTCLSQKKKFLFLIIFLFCLIFTKSRSGIGTLFILLVFDFLIENLKILISKKNHTFSKKNFNIFIFVFLIIILYLTEIMDRFLIIFNEGSSLARIEGFKNFFILFKEDFFLGVGYNNTVSLSSALGNNIDSALLVILLSHGIFFGTLFILFLFHFILNIYKKNNINSENSFYLNKIINYFIVIFFITGNFNLIFFEYFFIIPIFGIFFYFRLISTKL